MKQFLLGKQENATSQSYIWNTLGGVLNAGQSALILMVISRTNSPSDAGIFSIAYAVACLALTIGNFGMRSYQATDIENKFNFRAYLFSRIISDIGMLLYIIYYVIKGIVFLDYPIDKCVVIVTLGLSKMVDSIEDVFHGKYQRMGRLDIAGRCLATRYILMIGSFSMSLIISKNLIISSVCSFAISLIYFIYTTCLVNPTLEDNFGMNISKSIWSLFKDCLPLFLGSFLAIYIANAPKYAIDEFGTDVEQANFNYIFMPVYVVSLLNTFLFQPIITGMAHDYEERNYTSFMKKFFRQVLVIITLVLCVILAGYLLGIPVLNIFYNAELEEYKSSFMILLIGSGFLAMEGYFQAILTIMRKQQWLVIGFLISALSALVLAKPIVLKQGVKGASMLYTGIVMVQMIVFLIMFTWFWRTKTHEIE
ncbi:MAG: lipopolysaccharide biosynthesis protein [Lachnospiraceae bacterium]|nr:lipopolysaccharide biosynthesis protein [Lachnospiraceae bacterium]